MDISERIQLLTKFLHQCDQRYFLYNESPIQDQDYDLLSQELQTLKASIQDYKEAPLFKDFQNNNPKTPHQFPMLSLQKIYELEDLDNFFQKSDNGQGPAVTMELKIDGVSVSLIYKGGLLVQGLSRGDGSMGEDITHNIFHIKSIPLIIKDEALQNTTITIRGELYIKKSNHAAHFNHQIHPRNICAGLIRKKYMDEAGDYIDFFAYNIFNHNTLNQKENLQQLQRWGFPVEPHYQVINNLQTLHEQLEYWRHNIAYLDYECDGVVLKINNISLFNQLGSTISHPRGALAFKFANKKKTTYLETIQWQVGKNGRVTPVGLVHPVVIDGVTIKKVTLHNYDFVKNLKNRTVIIERAGGVIPKVIKIENDTMEDDVKDILVVPAHCPSCHQVLLVTEKDIICGNYGCPKQKLERLLHFCDQLKIYGIGEKIMDKLIQEGIIDTYVDILKASQYKNGLEGISLVIWTKFLKQVEKLPRNYQVLKGITLGYGGEKNLQKIIDLLGQNRDFLDYPLDALINFLMGRGFTEGIGTLIAKSLLIIKDDIKLLMDWADGI
jgi:DNA ligase (NAD+)